MPYKQEIQKAILMGLLLILFGINHKSAAQSTAKDTVRFTLRDTFLTRGDTTVVWMRTAKAMKLSGIQFGLQYDTSQLRIISVSSPFISRGDIRDQYDHGVHKFFIYNTAGNLLSIKDRWLELSFLSSVKGNLSGYVKWSEKFQSFVIDEDLDDFPLKIEFKKGTTAVRKLSGEASMWIQPNPSPGMFTLSASSQVLSGAEIQVLSAEGRLIAQKKLQRRSQEGRIFLPMELYCAPGLYYLIIKHRNNNFIRKIIIE